MPSLTDELMGKTPEGAKQAAEAAMKALGAGRNMAKEGENAVKGICLLMINCAEFTADTVMGAAKRVAFNKTGDIKYSKNNISIKKLKESGHVYNVEENVLQESMKYFDAQCKKHGIKYSAMKDTRGEDKPDYKPSYMVFFEGKDTDLIMHVLKEACKDYAADQERQREAGEAEKGPDNQTKTKQRGRRLRERESVKAKLAFFRNRVAARDKERDAVEKHHSHSDIQR